MVRNMKAVEHQQDPSRATLGVVEGIGAYLWWGMHHHPLLPLDETHRPARTGRLASSRGLAGDAGDGSDPR